MILRSLKSHPDQIDVALRGSDASSRLFLKAVQNINGTTEANGISGAVGIRIEILNQLKDSGTSKALEGFGVGMFLTALRQIESVPKNILYICGKLLEVFLAATNPQEWLPCTHAKIYLFGNNRQPMPLITQPSQNPPAPWDLGYNLSGSFRAPVQTPGRTPSPRLQIDTPASVG